MWFQWVKVSEFGVFSGAYIPAFGLNTKIYGKYGPAKYPNLDTFHVVDMIVPSFILWEVCSRF